ncbi:serine hydrolase domain-containing protein [Sandaracinobacteroides saxicola]|uniref:Serine hydrolase n=1 Tax=Sandaracinobacteroides saxicola TaxID=2759707 RepID=A0A7G5IJB4_9SPHN|nr:serine hydrolase [Sandaracinobacteroides saxicola]QMW23456.1 serine hydrolase [Sandaracinobacteroides saxicola]
MPAEARIIADRFFADRRLAETRAIVVLKDGVPIYERYAPGYNATTRLIGWSMSKSITATLVGQLVGEGKLSLDAAPVFPEWANDARRAITLRHMLHMSSGLSHRESSPQPELDDTIRILFTDRAQDAARWSKAKPLEAAPGARYEYSTATSILLADKVQRTLSPGLTNPEARKKAMRAALISRLMIPAGMPSLLCEYDNAGTMHGGSLCHATALDWARFGQLYLNKGVASGQQVVPAAWVDFVGTPAATDSGYGGHFWLNRRRPAGRDVALFPTQGPADAYAAIGHLGQYVIIVPSKRLVVVRLGKTQDDVLEPVRVALGRLVNSLPDSR